MALRFINLHWFLLSYSYNILFSFFVLFFLFSFFLLSFSLFYFNSFILVKFYYLISILFLYFRHMLITPHLKSSDLHFLVVNCHCQTYDDNIGPKFKNPSFAILGFIVHIASLTTFFSRHFYFLLIWELFEHIFEHINSPLLGLFRRIEKCRTKEIMVVLLASA